MCAYRDIVQDIEYRLKDVPLYHSELKTTEIVDNGVSVRIPLFWSTSGKVYKLGEKIDIVQKGVGEIRKLYQLQDNLRTLDYNQHLVAKIYPLNTLRRNRKGDDFIQEIIIHDTASKLAAGHCLEGIVPFYESLLTDNSLMLIMPFYNKKDLFYFLTQNTALLSVETIKPVFRRMAKAVALLHEDGLVHRDISCENIYYKINEDEPVSEEAVKRAKRESETVFDLGDFGMSGHVSQCAEFCQSLGKPSYKSPQLMNEKLETQEDWLANDVWALGVVLYLLLMKNFPFGSAKKGDHLFYDRIINCNLVASAERELSRSCYNAFRSDQQERIKGLQLAQRMLRYNVNERLSMAAICNDLWLQDESSILKNSCFANIFHVLPYATSITNEQTQFILRMEEIRTERAVADDAQRASASLTNESQSTASISTHGAA